MALIKTPTITNGTRINFQSGGMIKAVDPNSDWDVPRVVKSGT